MDNLVLGNIVTVPNVQLLSFMHLLRCTLCVWNILFRDSFLLLLLCKIFLLFGGDAKDAFAHSPSPEVPTFMMIDNQ